MGKNSNARDGKGMREFPLAVYTAEHGLAWKYPKGEIGFAELDVCRKALGPLPDFDAGEKGYEGVWAKEDRVFALSCFSVKKWDFRGRDATYLAVTWMPRELAAGVNFEALLSTSVFHVASHSPEEHFEADVGRQEKEWEGDFSGVGREIRESIAGEELRWRRNEGESRVRRLAARVGRRTLETVTVAPAEQAETEWENGVGEAGALREAQGGQHGRWRIPAMVAAVAMVVLLLALGWLAWKQRTAQQTILKGELQQLQREVDALEGQLPKMREQLRPDGTESEARKNGVIESPAEATGMLAADDDELMTNGEVR